jgi:hypothetical protein
MSSKAGLPVTHQDVHEAQNNAVDSAIAQIKSKLSIQVDNDWKEGSPIIRVTLYYGSDPISESYAYIPKED